MPLLRECKCGCKAYDEKDLTLFVKNKSGRYGRSNQCNKCKQKRNRESYPKREHNNDSRNLRHREDRRVKKERAIFYKGNKCSHCGITYNGVNEVIFDFHHIEPTTKDRSISKLTALSWENIVKEIDKCILLCSNCHKLEHKRMRYG